MSAHDKQGTSWLQPLRRTTGKMLEARQILSRIGWIGDDVVHRFRFNRVCRGHIRANQPVSIGD